MTTSCYLPVFYCFWLSLSTRSFLKFSLKNFRDCFIVQLSMFFVVVFSQATFNTLSYLSVFVNNFFNLFFRLFQVRSCFFATAIIDYHIFMILSTYFLIFLSCFLSRCSAHATACLYYHYFPGMSTPFLKYF